MTKLWHILGAGAIGSLFASSLHRAGIPTTLLHRAGKGSARTSVISIDKNGVTEELSFPVSYNDEPDAISHLLVCTKAYDVHAALSDVKHRLNGNSSIVILVNGMGYMDSIKSDFPSFQFTVGTTTEGAYRLDAVTARDSKHFCHAGNGTTRLGQSGMKEPPPWFKDWSAIDLPCTWEANIDECLWKKLAVNCAINPLSALHGCKNGELAARPELAKLLKQLCDEIAELSLVAGFGNTSINIHSWVDEVIAGTSDNRSSMLQDILAGRRTENDYISGYFLKLARQFEVATPCNKAVYEGILQLDQHR